MVEPKEDVAGLLVLPKLTSRQESALIFIGRFLMKNRDYPTQRELARELGISQNGAAGVLNALMKKGYINKIPGMRRNIRFTELAIEKLQILGVDMRPQLRLALG